MDIPRQETPQLRTARCCPSHPTLQRLTEHLVIAFPTVTPQRIVEAVVDAARGSSSVKLDDDELVATVELLARHNLSDLVRQAPPASMSAEVELR
jgi:hypothetical protein